MFIGILSWRFIVIPILLLGMLGHREVKVLFLTSHSQLVAKLGFELKTLMPDPKHLTMRIHCS